MEKIGRIPAKGTEYREGRARYTVLEGSRRAVTKLRVEIIRDTEE